jgi:hypothetical protein
MKVLSSSIQVVMKIVESIDENGDVVRDYEAVPVSIPMEAVKADRSCYFTRRVSDTETEFRVIELEGDETVKDAAAVVWEL